MKFIENFFKYILHLFIYILKIVFFIISKIVKLLYKNRYKLIDLYNRLMNKAQNKYYKDQDEKYEEKQKINIIQKHYNHYGSKKLLDILKDKKMNYLNRLAARNVLMDRK